jgi:splicing factor 3A subunit 3
MGKRVEVSGVLPVSTRPLALHSSQTSLYSGQKNYSKQTVYDAHLTSKKHVKAAAKEAASGEPSANPNGKPAASAPPTTATQSSAKSRIRNSAHLTYLTTSLLVSLAPTLNETKSNVERRFSLTAREREQELLDQAKPPPPPVNPTGDGPAEEEEEEERIYNPLKLPLGWDGKPIPYWLYKLHGLGVEYRCEICSDHVYMGRKNFDRHFQVRQHWLRHCRQSYSAIGITACIRYARSWPPEHQAFPRNHTNRRCPFAYVQLV